MLQSQSFRGGLGYVLPADPYDIAQLALAGDQGPSVEGGGEWPAFVCGLAADAAYFLFVSLVLGCTIPYAGFGLLSFQLGLDEHAALDAKKLEDQLY